MYARTYGAATMGVEGLLIDVEVDAANGLPGFEMVGMPDTLVREAKERVRTAIRNSGIMMHQERVTVNLAPAAIRKESAGLDLPIAIALLAADGIIGSESIGNYAFIGELSLEGRCRPVRGVLPMAIKALDMGLKGVFISRENVQEALLVKGLTVYGVENLRQVVEHLQNHQVLSPACKLQQADCPRSEADFGEVQGQFLAKRAFEVAAAGGHNILLSGAPGSGKTMLARRMGSILPEMTDREALEVTRIYSIAGMLKEGEGLIRQRPFRSPHHTVSAAAMIGGGTIPRPGEVTLSHNGVLFLDELPEFGQRVLECLRQPLEDGTVTVSRANASYRFPSRIILIGAMNPCPCGFLGDKEKQCTCSDTQIQRYQSRLSGPLLDRIDLVINVPRLTTDELIQKGESEPSAKIRERIVRARKIQAQRYQNDGILTNSELTTKLIKKYCVLSDKCTEILKFAAQKYNLSGRKYNRILKLARTIADLDNSENITELHISQALQYKSTT